MQIVGVTTETDKAMVKKFVQKMGSKMDYTVAIDMNGQVSKDYMDAYGVMSIPHAFVVDAEGQIIWVNHPAQSSLIQVLEKAVLGLDDPNYTPDFLSKMTDDEFLSLSESQLKSICSQNKIESSSFSEKQDFVKAIREQINKN